MLPSFLLWGLSELYILVPFFLWAVRLILNAKSVKVNSWLQCRRTPEVRKTLILEDTISGTYWESCKAGSATGLQQDKTNKYIHSHTGCQVENLVLMEVKHEVRVLNLFRLR